MRQTPPPSRPSMPPGGREALEAGFWAVVRAVLALIGLAFVLVGLVLFPLPIPLGLPLILVGLVLLARNAAWARGLILRFAHRHPGLTAKAPRWLKKALLGEPV